MGTRAEAEHERLNLALERIAALEDALASLVGEVQAYSRHIVGMKPRGERKMDYVLWDLDTDRDWSFSDVQEARATAEQMGFRHWSIMRGEKIVDQNHENGPFVDLRKRYASVLLALDAVPPNHVLNLIHMWADLNHAKGDLLDELGEGDPLYWVRATDLGEDDATT